MADKMTTSEFESGHKVTLMSAVWEEERQGRCFSSVPPPIFMKLSYSYKRILLPLKRKIALMSKLDIWSVFGSLQAESTGVVQVDAG